jgi:hypothetical protein
MTPWLEPWQPNLIAAAGLFRHFPTLERLFVYFRYEGIGSIALWMLALLLLLAYALRWRWSLVCWTALAVAIGGFALAKVNSHNVSAIEIDFSEQLEAAKARADEEAAGAAAAAESDMSDEARQAQRAEAEEKETNEAPNDRPESPAPEDSTPNAKPDSATSDEPAQEGPNNNGQPATADPRYSYRQAGKAQRAEGKQLEEKIPIDSATNEEAVAPISRKMKMQEVAEANRLDRFNLFFARWTLYLAAGLFVIDYFRRFNTTFHCYLPLPLSGPLVDAIFPKSHTVCVGRSRRKWEKYLARAVRKGETFVYFSDEDPWPQQRLRRLPWYLPLPWSIEKVTCSDGDRHFDDEFLLESAWFGRYCFVLVGEARHALDLLDSLAKFLELRRATRASARRTVNVVWNRDTDVPPATLQRLLPLIRETNFRLIVTRNTPPEAALTNGFEEINLNL